MTLTLKCLLITCTLALGLSTLGIAQDPQAAKPPAAKRIVFLGDSITHAGLYVAILESALRAQYPNDPIPELINLGLPSETVSGLSEPGHAGGAFPRPNLHERLGRILAESKPDLVVACYGMNCGMYYPLSQDRFDQFKSGIERLHSEVEKTGAKIIHLTPAFFDALPIRDRLLPDGLDEYRQPYAKYDDVLEAYSKWLLEQRSRNWTVLDVHGAMKSAVMKARESNPNFTLASDGVHPNASGQAIVAKPLAEHWGLSLDADGLPKHPKSKELLELVANKQNKLKLAWLSITKHTRPGIPEGQKLDQVTLENKQIDEKIAQLLKQ
ncbi:MAG: SGNH/GDSL hydrolase family protein [Pirellula sp.]